MNNVVKYLSLKEKIALCSGQNEWDTKEMRTKEGALLVPSVKVADGPHGLRKTVGKGDNLGLAASYPATCFPAESLMACSFDEEIAREMGAAIASEARQEGVCTILGPGANIKRNPLCGRNFEYLSEDPFLSGRMAASYIEGAKERGIGTSLKHFACNSQEYFRMTSDSRVDERTLREIYLPAFEYAVKEAKPATVMCAYNRLNGVACSDNRFLLDHILRKEWGYEGLVVSDWGALNDRVSAFEAGCDLIMPGGSALGEKDAEKAVKNGRLSETFIDRSAARVASFALEQRTMMEDENGRYLTADTMEEIHEKAQDTARRIAENSAVLMKNKEELLPLDFGNEKLCVIGSMARTFRFQGSGSSKIHPTKKPDFLKRMAVYQENVPFMDGYDEQGNTTEEMIGQAVRIAKEADKVLLFAGLPEQYEAEGIDRRSLQLPEGQNRLIEAVAEANPRVIVVLLTGCVVELPWEPKVPALLWMGLSGQAGDRALLRILSGEVNPSGKLTETWPLQYEDCPSADSYLKCGKDAEYREGLYVGYRYYEKKQKPVRFPFGHGLSYTSFAYSGLQITREGVNFRIRVKVKNTGAAAGAEAVLFYIEAPQDGIDRPLRELKGFQKVLLAAKEEKEVCFLTDERSFAVWNGEWTVYRGDYGIVVGTERARVFVEGANFDEIQESAEFINSVRKSEPETAEKYDKNSSLAEVAQDVLLIRLLYRWFEKQQEKSFGKGSAEYLAAMSSAEECPLRAVQSMLGIRNHFAEGIAAWGNGHFFGGIRQLFS